MSTKILYFITKFYAQRPKEFIPKPPEAGWGLGGGGKRGVWQKLPLNKNLCIG